MKKEGVLTDTLAKNRTSTHGSEIYMGVCQLDPKLPHRRIDIKCFPKEQFGCAVLYFTGSDFFNRSMRYFAKKKGFLLAEHGLYEAHRSGGTIAVEEQVVFFYFFIKFM